MNTLIQGSANEFSDLIRQVIREELAAALPQTAPNGTKQPAATKPEVAEHLGISISKLNIMMKTGEIKYFKIGRQVFFKWSDIEAYINKK